MGKSSTAPSRLVRISSEAWDMATAAVRDGGHGGDHQPDGPAWAELTQAGIALDDHVTAPWREALAVAADPAIVLRITATYNGISGQSTISIAGARIVCVQRRRAFGSTADGGVRITGTEPAVEVSLFSTDTFWNGVRRILPPLPQLRAGAAEATAVLEADHGVDDATALEVAVNCTSQVTAELAAYGGGTPTMWSGMWAVHDERLYSIRTRRVDGRVAAVVVPVQAGHLAREIGFALVGALAGSVQGGAE